jgi:hypothetical protein
MERQPFADRIAESEREQLPKVGARESGVVGAHAVVSGYAAALIERLVVGNWRARLRGERIAGDDLREIEAAMSALREAADGWRRDQLPKPGGASAGGNRGPAAEGQRKSGLPRVAVMDHDEPGGKDSRPHSAPSGAARRRGRPSGDQGGRSLDA